MNPIGESRWDSEYYQKLFVEELEKINRLPHKKLSNYAHFIRKGIFDMSPDYYQNNGIPFIRTSEIKDPTINFSTTVFLSKKLKTQTNKQMMTSSISVHKLKKCSIRKKSHMNFV